MGSPTGTPSKQKCSPLPKVKIMYFQHSSAGKMGTLPPPPHGFFYSSYVFQLLLSRDTTNIVVHLILGLYSTHTCTLQLIYTLLSFLVSLWNILLMITLKLEKISYLSNEIEFNCWFDTFSNTICVTLLCPKSFLVRDEKRPQWPSFLQTFSVE